MAHKPVFGDSFGKKPAKVVKFAFKGTILDGEFETMVSKNCVMRVTRPTDNLFETAKMYEKGLGFKRLDAFTDHGGFDGVVLGHPHHAYHLQLTTERGKKLEGTPHPDSLIAFYIPDEQEWQDTCNRMEAAGFKDVESRNPYWDTDGRTFEDPDGYRVVLRNRTCRY